MTNEELGASFPSAAITDGQKQRAWIEYARATFGDEWKADVNGCDYLSFHSGWEAAKKAQQESATQAAGR